jgi:hypothetical protein
MLAEGLAALEPVLLKAPRSAVGAAVLELLRSLVQREA